MCVVAFRNEWPDIVPWVIFQLVSILALSHFFFKESLVVLSLLSVLFFSCLVYCTLFPLCMVLSWINNRVVKYHTTNIFDMKLK